MKKNYIQLLTALLLACCSFGQVMAQCTPTAGASQTALVNGSFAWGGPTASTVSVTYTDEANSIVGERVVELFTMTGAAYSYTGATLGNFNVPVGKVWHKNGGYIGPATTPAPTNQNKYLARVDLTFSNPVPISEIFLQIQDADTRGVADVVPDGFIRITGGGARPATTADLEVLTWNAANQSQAGYNSATGDITWGIGAVDANPSKYVSLAGKTTKGVSKVVFFIRNVKDDVHFSIAWLRPCAALPIKLSDFTGILSSATTARLDWDVSSVDADFSRFELERSTDGSTFAPVATIASANKMKYSYSDNVAALVSYPVIYYRLKMIDRNGSFEYSKIVSVRPVPLSDGGIRVSPNPAHATANVEYKAARTGQARIDILTLTGQKVMSMQRLLQAGKNVVTIDGLQKLAPGTYYLHLTDSEGSVKITRLIIN